MIALINPYSALPEEPVEEKFATSILTAKLIKKNLRAYAPNLSGVVKSESRGEGTDLSFIRQYAFGDDVRKIDWAGYSRTGILHVKENISEKQPVIWLAVDLSSSMYFGRKLGKINKALQLALCISYVAKISSSRLGAAFAGEKMNLLLPSSKKSNINKITSYFYSNRSFSKDSIKNLVKNLIPFLKRNHQVVLMSDFIDADFNSISLLSSKCKLKSIFIKDEADTDIPDNIGNLNLKDPETNKIVRLSKKKINLVKKAVLDEQKNTIERLKKLGDCAEAGDILKSILQIWRVK